MAKLSGRAANKIVDAVKRFNGLPNDNVGDQNGLARASRREFWAKITDNGTLDDGRHKYAWEFTRQDEDGFQDSDDPNVRKGDLEPGDDGVARYAIDANEWPSDPLGDAIGNDKVVRMYLDYYTGDDGKPKPRYTFSSGGGDSGKGQYMGQVCMMTSNNQKGYVYPFAHDMV